MTTPEPAWDYGSDASECMSTPDTDNVVRCEPSVIGTSELKEIDRTNV